MTTCNAAIVEEAEGEIAVVRQGIFSTYVDVGCQSTAFALFAIIINSKDVAKVIAKSFKLVANFIGFGAVATCINVLVKAIELPRACR